MLSASVRERAERGDIEAQLALGEQCSQSNVREARGWFARAAKAGSVTGVRRLAISLMTQHPLEPAVGINMIHAAAEKGDAHAAHICAVLAAGNRALSDRWTVARTRLKIAAERGWEPARQELALLDSFANRAFKPEPRALFASPRISEIRGFLSEAECDWVIQLARPLLRRAEVYNLADGAGLVTDDRSNSGANFGLLESDVMLMQVRERISRVFGDLTLEDSSVLHYAPGQEFKPHYDFLDASRPGLADDLAKHGQRAVTFLIYLNEGFEGGATAFPKLDFRFKGRKGDAIYFWNLDESGRPDFMTEHAGSPPTSGEKWLFSQWLRAQRHRING